MKVLRILAFMSLIVLISCDPIWSVSINGKKELILKKDVGCNAKLIVENSHGTRFRFIFLNENSFIKVENVKYLISVLEANNNAFSDFFPFYRDKDTVMLDDKGRFLFQAQLKDNNDLKKDVEFIIPPNKYLLCKDLPLISDTVKIILNVGKVKVGPRSY